MLILAAVVLLSMLLGLYCFRHGRRPDLREMRWQVLALQYSKIRSAQRESADPALEWLAKALPRAGWRPNLAGAQVTLDGRSFTSPDFHQTAWRQRADIAVEGRVRGEVQVCYRQPMAAGQNSDLAGQQARLEEAARDSGLMVWRLETERELRRRERILDAITKIARGLLREPELERALRTALAQAGEAIGADRVLLLETLPAARGPARLLGRGAWNAPGVEPRLPEFFASHADLLSLPQAFFASLTGSEIATILARRRTDDFGRFLRSLNVQSVLLVPVLAGAEPWGYLVLDDCHRERVWSTVECDALQVLAEVIGASVARERRTAELSEAKRIVENSTTVLYRAAAAPGLPTTYISANVSRWGYTPAQFLATPTFYQTLIHPDDQAQLRERIERRLQGAPPAATLEIRVQFADGTYHWFENRIAAVRHELGRAVAFEGTLTDIDERKRAAEEVGKRERILDAIAKVAAGLMAARSLDELVPGVLHRIGEAVDSSRVIVLESKIPPGGVRLVTDRYVWNAPGVQPQIQADALGDYPRAAAAGVFFDSLPKGQASTLFPARMEGELALLLRLIHIRSVLLVPILVDAEPWGYLAFDDCRSERVWSMAESDALQVMAEVIGAAVARERRLAELSEAKRIVENSTTILFRCAAEPSLPITYVSPNVSKWGYQAAPLIASPTLYHTLVHPEDQATLEEWERNLFTDSQPAPPLELRLRLGDGSYRWFESRIVPIRDEAGQLTGFEGTLSDIDERKQAEQELAELARTDALTGLANRATFLERLDLMFAASRRGASPFAVLYVDLDNFKDVNDAFGHAAGDDLLKTAGQRVAASVRATDLVARFGGDEFAVLQADVEDPSTCGTLANKIRARLAEPYGVKGSELRITTTVGIAVYSPEIENPAQVLERADRALYRGKEEGRDRYCFHSAELDVLVHERITLSEELRKAIEQDQLELHYQPQVDIATGRIVGVEALVRWNHPRRGQLKPADFLATAERTGVIGPLGDWVLDRACQQLRRWRDQKLAPPVMAVNLSGVQLRLGRDFDRKVAATLAKWGLGPQDLELDVAEAVLAGSPTAQPDILERLRDLGVRIAIDDFGSDYTSIGRVKAYQVKRFKIAPQFIHAMTNDPVNAGVVRMMINVARQLGIEVIAKSVETEEQRDFLRSLAQAVQAQGFYYSEPLDAERATRLLRTQMELHPVEGPELARR